MMRAGATFAALLASVSVAAGATLNLGGDYGSPEGCSYLKDQTLWGEAVTVLTPTYYKDFVTSCEFIEVLPASDGSSIVTMLCMQEEGEQTIDLVRVVKAENGDAYGLYNATGGRWAELAACPRIP
jgi:hypothetical protein